MILARIANALRRQDWTTVAVEFVLVVVGVLVALQVDNWNQQRVAERKFRNELALLQTEFQANSDHLAWGIERIEHNLTVLSAFQRAFHDRDPAPSDEQRKNFLPTLTTTGDYGMFVRGSSVDRLLRSDHIVEKRFQSLRQALERWSLTFSGYRQAASNRLRYGSDVVLPLFTETHSLVASAARALRDTPYRLNLSARQNELETALEDPRVESAIAILLIMEIDVLAHAGYLNQHSERVIDEIERLLTESAR